MKLIASIIAVFLALSCAKGAPPTREEVSSAIALLETSCLTNGSVEAARVVVNFGKESPEVQVSFTSNTVPWLPEKWGLEPKMEKTIRSMLLAAYCAGNIKSQLAAGKATDDPYAGWLLVCKCYAQFRTKVLFSSPSIDALNGRRKEGTLSQYARDIVKDAQKEATQQIH